MGYRIERDEAVDDAVARVLREQIDKALRAVEDENPHEAVHAVRKRCKKCRAVVRLTRKSFDGYREANTWFRDTARPLASLREASAHLETFDALVERHREALDVDTLGQLRGELVSRRERLAQEAPIERRLEEARARLERAREEVGAYATDASGFDAMGGGLRKTLRRCGERLEEAMSDDDPDVFHTWRKRVKYHRYHLKLVRRAWSPMLDARRAEAHRLTDLLGELNDLVELRATLRREKLASSDDVQWTVEALGRRRMKTLRDRSRHLGARLFAEPADAFVARVERWWHTP